MFLFNRISTLMTCWEIEDRRKPRWMERSRIASFPEDKTDLMINVVVPVIELFNKWLY